jgi:FAD/FMN-containing dehydrogenase
MDLREAVSQEIHSVAVDLGGSFSAEHGIGSLKRNELNRLSDPVSLSLMRTIKAALDPAGIMNPGKLFL